MSGLPEIPDEAVAAVHKRRRLRPVPLIRRDLKDAWPHLYEAALRHAADELGYFTEIETRDELRRLADEATR
jgi:hypothetical protein